MLKPTRLLALSRSLTPRSALPVQRIAGLHTTFSRNTDTKIKDYRMAVNTKNAPPAHEMVHFKNLLSSKRAFGDFRTVLHTGLYSQIVAMEVPVGGEIGDEVRVKI